MVSSVMLVKMPVTRLLERSSFSAVRRPMSPPSTALSTLVETTWAVSAFSLSVICHRALNSTPKFWGTAMPSERAVIS